MHYHCNEGEMCDCTPDLDDAEQLTHLTNGEKVLLVLIMLLSCTASLYTLYAAFSALRSVL